MTPDTDTFLYIGACIGKRALQLGLPEDELATVLLAVRDVFTVIGNAEGDPLVAMSEFFELEASL